MVTGILGGWVVPTHLFLFFRSGQWAAANRAVACYCWSFWSKVLILWADFSAGKRADLHWWIHAEQRRNQNSSYTRSKIPTCELTYPTIWKRKIIFNLALSSRYAIVPRRVNQNVHLAFIRPTEMWGVICLKNVCVWFLWVVDRLVSNHTKKNTQTKQYTYIIYTCSNKIYMNTLFFYLIQKVLS